MNVLIIEQQIRAQDMLESVVRQAFHSVDLRRERTLEIGKRTAWRMDALDMVLLDPDMPGCEGPEALIEFKEALPEVPVVAVCGSPEPKAIALALQAGAAGYIPKGTRHTVMMPALQLVAAGGVFVPPQAIACLTLPADDVQAGAVQRLTPRQREVLRLVLKGHSNPAIAADLRIALGTVKHHVHALLKAFRVSRRTQLLAVAKAGGVRSDGSPVTDAI